MTHDPTPSFHDWPEPLQQAIRRAQNVPHKKQPKPTSKRKPAQSRYELPPQPPGVIVVDCPLPPRSLHPNGRATWQRKASDTKRQREHSAMAARLATANRTDIKLPWPDAVLDCVFLGVKESADDDGLRSWAKQTVDGIADVLAAGQDHGWIISSVETESCRSGQLLRVTIRPTTNEEGSQMDPDTNLRIDGSTPAEQLFCAHAKCVRSQLAFEMNHFGGRIIHMVSDPMSHADCERKIVAWKYAVESSGWQFSIEPYTLGETK